MANVESHSVAVEQARADFYAVVSTLLLKPPADAFLRALAAADALITHEAEPDRLSRSWEKLVLAAQIMNPALVRDEFAALFTDAVNPPVNPYASLYLSGFLMEKPLAALRADLGRLGLARAEESRELEDHLGALCETMRILIGQERTLVIQSAFFNRHVASWFSRCTEDIRQQPAANFYRVAADFIDAFLELEVQAFAMDETGEFA